MTSNEVLISIDVETSGPIPGEFSLLSIGACAVDDPDRQFECYLQPITEAYDPKALEVSGLSLDELRRTGLTAEAAMRRLEEWVNSVTDESSIPVMVGFNAPFDWSFVNYYFHRFLGRNPFGFSAIDIKAYYMGVSGSSWHDTRSSVMRKALNASLEGDHNALNDALAQAELFRLVRAHHLRSRV
jgi:DNA polymerase III epsilon subunit-like protein